MPGTTLNASHALSYLFLTLTVAILWLLLQTKKTDSERLTGRSKTQIPEPGCVPTGWRQGRQPGGNHQVPFFFPDPSLFLLGYRHPLSGHKSGRTDTNAPAISFCRRISQKHNINFTCTVNKHLIPSIVLWSICRGNRTT